MIRLSYFVFVIFYAWTVAFYNLNRCESEASLIMQRFQQIGPRTTTKVNYEMLTNPMRKFAGSVHLR